MGGSVKRSRMDAGGRRGANSADVDGFNEVDIDQNKLSRKKAVYEINQIIHSFDLRECKIYATDQPHSPVKSKDIVYISETEQQRILIPFIVAVVLAADWYDRQMAHSRSRRDVLSALSVGLMVALPIAVWLISTKLHGNVVSGVGAILTGLLGIQRTLASWIDAQCRFGNQWRARSALRDILYSLQTKWAGAASAPSEDGLYWRLGPDFLADLSAATISGRAAVRTEQQQFFDSMASPTPDLLSGLASTPPILSNLTAAAQRP